MQFNNLDSKEYIFHDTLDSCLEKGEELKKFLHILYTDKKIAGYSTIVIRSDDEALEEDLDFDEEAKFPLLWLNITYDITKLSEKDLTTIKGKYNLEDY